MIIIIGIKINRDGLIINAAKNRPDASETVFVLFKFLNKKIRIEFIIKHDAKISVNNNVDAWIKYGFRKPTVIIEYQINLLLFFTFIRFAMKIIVIRYTEYWKILIKILIFTKSPLKIK